jgi:membrane-anchored protein YejM (alkaline phosphatase superfamily)
MISQLTFVKPSHNVNLLRFLVGLYILITILGIFSLLQFSHYLVAKLEMSPFKKVNKKR